MASLALAFDLIAKDSASPVFRRVGAAADDTGRKVSDAGERGGKRFGNGIKAGVAVAAGAFASLQVASFLKGTIDAASDLGETTSKVSVLFGDAAGQIEQFAAGAAKGLGQSKQQAMDAAATFAIFGKSAGLSGKQLAEFSTDFVGLASDLASFNNTSPEEAIEAIGSALRGEAEPLRRYGVLLDDASMRQEAVRLGIIKTTKEALTPQQKVLAAQALIYKQTSAAQGDFARTSDGLANKQRILSAQFDNVKTAIGERLLPVALSLATFVNDRLLPALATVGDTASQMFDILFRGDFTGGPLQEDSWLVDVLFRIRDAVGDVVDKFRDEIIPAVAEFISQSERKLRPVLDWMWERLKEVYESVSDNVQGYKDFTKAVKDFGVEADTHESTVGAFAGAFGLLATAIAAGNWQLNTMLGYFADVAEFINKHEWLARILGGVGANKDLLQRMYQDATNGPFQGAPAPRGPVTLGSRIDEEKLPAPSSGGSRHPRFTASSITIYATPAPGEDVATTIPRKLRNLMALDG